MGEAGPAVTRIMGEPTMAMDELALEAFERRAKEAEERLARIEKQVSSNAGGGMSGERLTEVLTVLYEVRSTLGMEKTRNEVNEKKQRSLERANSELAEENSKLKYQIL